MMYICEDCGKKFEDPDISEHEESRGECFGFPSYETVVDFFCPYCGSEDFEESEDEE